VLRQTTGTAEIVVVDDGSTDPLTRQFFASFRRPRTRLLRMPHGGLAAARNRGLAEVRTELVSFLDADDVLEPTFLEHMLAALDADSSLAFASSWLRTFGGAESLWSPETCEFPRLLAEDTVCTAALMRTETVRDVGGFDGAMPAAGYEDWDLAITLVSRGLRGTIVREPLMGYRIRPGSMSENCCSPENHATLMRYLVEKHAECYRRHFGEVFETIVARLHELEREAPDEARLQARARATEIEHAFRRRLAAARPSSPEDPPAGAPPVAWQDLLLDLENARRALQAEVQRPVAAVPPTVALNGIDWGSLRRLEPISPVWGFDRGKPIDRYFIEKFLAAHRTDIRGRVLEVKDTAYTDAFGTGVETADAVDVAPTNPQASLVADLTVERALPENRYDCFILTQTLHVTFDVEHVVANVLRTLRPGGVALVTLPCVSRVDYESGVDGDYWRFTAASARRLFERAFGNENVEVECFGNVLAATAFLMGVATEELRPEELDYRDPYHPLLVCVRATKPRPQESSEVRANRGRALVLLYHRIADPPSRDRWSLCVSPSRFAAHMRWLRANAQPERLSGITSALRSRRLPDRVVAVTFDDGYREQWTAAAPVLRELAIPATFFIAGELSIDGESFWWEVLDASLEAARIPDAEAEALHRRLMRADTAERRRVLADLPPGRTPLPAPLSVSEMYKLAQESGVEIGAHGHSHRTLAGLPVEQMRFEMAENMSFLSAVARSPIRSFAYPFGGPAARDASRVFDELGIEAAVTVETAPVTSESDPLAMPRVAVGDWSETEFAARISELLDA
jgi:peptidoglycan/xylan/chitin deacetylase (PgdA/CDA1 family)